MIELKNLSFSYGSSKIVDNISLSVDQGDFVSLLGPSGSGKTTLLRLISGFLTPQEGKVIIDGQDVTEIEPNKRNTAYVFQDYALFPHMTVAKNIEYGLKIKKEGKLSDHTELLENLELTSLLDRFPHELSGGQQQRVALARSLVLNPKVILMDEPLSSLDAKLRNEVRDQLKSFQKNLGITTIYVTHDQEEALSLSDKIAVLDKGKIQQWGTPEEVYFEPANNFVAEITGRTNYLNLNGKTVLVRPTWLKPAGSNGELNRIKLLVDSTSFQGDNVLVSGKCSESSSGLVKAILSFEEVKEIKTGTEIELSVTRMHEF